MDKFRLTLVTIFLLAQFGSCGIVSFLMNKWDEYTSGYDLLYNLKNSNILLHFAAGRDLHLPHNSAL